MCIVVIRQSSACGRGVCACSSTWEACEPVDFKLGRYVALCDVVMCDMHTVVESDMMVVWWYGAVYVGGCGWRRVLCAWGCYRRYHSVAYS